MKRARKAAIIVSSDSENENEGNSDYEPDVKTKKNPSKKARIVKEKTTEFAKSKTKNKVVESKLLKSKTKENNCDNLPKKIKATENTNKARNKYLGGGLNDSLYDADPSWVPADVISRELNLDWNVTNTTCEVHKAACFA